MADNEKLIVELGIKNNNVNKEISNINRELKNLDKEVKSTDKTTKQYGQTNDTLKVKLSSLEKMYSLNAKKLEDYKKKMQSTTDTIKKQEEKISNMKLQGQDTVKAEEQLARMKQTLSNVGHQAKITENDMKGLEGAIKETNTALKDTNVSTYKQKLDNLSKSCASTSETLKSAGTTASNLGGNILKATAPLVALGTISTKMASDFETSFAQVTTIADENVVSNDKMKKSIMDLSNQTGISSNEIAGNVYDAISAGQKTGDAVNFVSNSTKLAKAGFAEAGQSLDLLTTILNSYGMEASEVTNVSDKLITTQNVGKTTVAQLSESMGKVIPTAKAVGVNLDNVSTSYALLTAKGIATSEAGTYVSSMLNELGKNGTTASKTLKQMSGSTFQELIASGKSLGDILAIMDEGAKKNGKSLLDMFGSAEAGKAGMVIATNAGKDYNDILKQMEQSAGATQIAFNKMDATPAERMAKSINKSKNEMIRLGQNILPMMDEVSSAIGKVADWFGKLTAEQQQTIIKTTLFTATFGGALKILGVFTSGLGGLVGNIGKVSSTLSKLSKVGKVAEEVEGLATATEVAGVGFAGLSTAILPIGIALATVGAGVYAYNQYQDGMSKSCVTSREELGLLKTTLIELNGVHVQSQDELEKSGLAYKKLGDDLGEDFKKKVEDSTKTINDFNYELGLVNVDEVLTADEADGLTTRVNGMVNSALEAIKSKSSETQSELSKMFLVKDNQIDESEQKVLDFVNTTGDKEIEEVNKLQGEIQEIYKGAVDNKRGLNEQEITDVKEKVARIQQIELEAQTNNQAEQLYAKNQFTERIKKADANTSVELLTERKKAIDTETTDLLANYQTQLDMLQQQKLKAQEQGNADAEANIQTQIDIKTKEKDEIVKKEQEKWDEAKKVMDEQQPQMIGKYNEFTGAMLSETDIKANQILKKMKENYVGLNEITDSGYYTIKNTATNAMEEIYVNVDENTGKITGCWNKTRGECGGATDTMAKDANKLGREYMSSTSTIQKALQDTTNTTVNSKGQIVNSNGDIVGSFEKVTDSAGNTLTKVKDINGNPIEIKDNSGQVIEDMSGVRKKIEEIPPKKDITFNFFQNGLNEITNALGKIGTKSSKIRDFVDNHATGTNNYSGGLSTVDEKGIELASNNSVAMLGSYYGNSLAYIPKGTGIRTHMQSISDMKAEVSRQVNNTVGGALINTLSKSFNELTKIQKENNKKQQNEIQENKKRNKENKDFQKGILYNGKFISNENIKEMKALSKEVNGLTLDGKYFANEALKYMRAKADTNGNILPETENEKQKKEKRRLNDGLTIGSTFYDKEALEKMKVCADGIYGIWVEGKFINNENVKEMRKQQRKQLKSVKVNGEYYSKNSPKSKSLVEHSNNYKQEVDYNKIGKQVANAMKDIIQGLGIEIDVKNYLDSKEISNVLTDTVINKLGKIDRNSRVSKGR
ncbi:phage tail tape measure protein [Clostridium uliginosum]|uniref:Phage tail tape measure protein, TP901 family, core region n=1 Tax=Clostridium uliginosum TaxID=119641 RepID=A0A1I1GTR9_9CLOT|nr:phage tail tape measure protein [Clostridium uliginosum]SFC15219.1 phage tail tape measure protein, TP901 family, core region [Clostridium uliginosum]